MGLAWSFVNPLLMLAVYTLVFSGIFGARWPGLASESTASFAVVLFAGLVVYGVFAECVNRAPGLVLANPNYVKRVIFPLEILPLVALGATLFHSGLSVAVLILAQVVVHQTLSWTAVLFPIVLLPLVLTTAGIAWFLASLGVYVRDVSQLTGVIVSVMMFLSPVFYPIAKMPQVLRDWLYLNPLALPIEDARTTLIFGGVPPPAHVALSLIVGIVIAQCGFWWFQKTRRGFADVL